MDLRNRSPSRRIPPAPSPVPAMVVPATGAGYCALGLTPTLSSTALKLRVVGTRFELGDSPAELHLPGASLLSVTLQQMAREVGLPGYDGRAPASTLAQVTERVALDNDLKRARRRVAMIATIGAARGSRAAKGLDDRVMSGLPS